jgi:hypothetical protein
MTTPTTTLAPADETVLMTDAPVVTETTAPAVTETAAVAADVKDAAAEAVTTAAPAIVAATTEAPEELSDAEKALQSELKADGDRLKKFRADIINAEAQLALSNSAEDKATNAGNIYAIRKEAIAFFDTIIPKFETLVTSPTTDSADLIATIRQNLDPLKKIHAEFQEKIKKDKQIHEENLAALKAAKVELEKTISQPSVARATTEDEKLLASLGKNIAKIEKLKMVDAAKFDTACVLSLNELAAYLETQKNKDGNLTAQSKGVLTQALLFTNKLETCEKAAIAELTNTFIDGCAKDVKLSVPSIIARVIATIGIVFLGLAIGLTVGGLIGIAAGAFTGPFAVLQSIVGMFSGAVYGANLAVAVGAAATGLVAGGSAATFFAMKKTPLQKAVANVAERFNPTPKVSVKDSAMNMFSHVKTNVQGKVNTVVSRFKKAEPTPTVIVSRM